MRRSFIGVNGGRVRENDEGYGRRKAPKVMLMTATVPGVCSKTGQEIKPGDVIYFNAVANTMMLCK